MKTYRVESPIKHNGKPHAVGAPIDLEDKHAAPLLAAGAISEGAVEAPAAGGEGDGKKNNKKK